MPHFHYTGIARDGSECRGDFEAVDERNLEDLLRERGIWLIQARLVESHIQDRWSSSRVSSQELITFCTLMGFQIQVGIHVLQALEITAQEVGSSAMGGILMGLKRGVESGSTLSSAMEEFPKAFPRDLVQLIRSGEQGGSLSESFLQAKQHLEWQRHVQGEIRQATLYPMLVLAAALGFVAVLFTGVVPKFVGLLTTLKIPLPTPTRVVFAVSDLTRNYGPWVLLTVGVLAIAVGMLKHRSLRMALVVDRFRLALPILGPLLRMGVMNRFAHNLAVLYRNGVTLPNALQLVGEMTGSPNVAQAVERVRTSILGGESLSEALRNHSVFPRLLIRLVRVGEQTGQLDRALEQLAFHYHQELPRRWKQLIGILEPTLILFLVILVGVVALAVILPVLSLMQSLH